MDAIESKIKNDHQLSEDAVKLINLQFLLIDHHNVIYVHFPRAFSFNHSLMHFPQFKKLNSLEGD